MRTREKIPAGELAFVLDVCQRRPGPIFMLTEQEEFNRLAMGAIHLQGRLGAAIGLDPDTSNAKQIEAIVLDALRRLPIVERKAVELDKQVTLMRHDEANLKVTIGTLRDRLRLFRAALETACTRETDPDARALYRDVLNVHDVP